MKTRYLTAVFFIIYLASHAQTPRNPMPRNINVPERNHISPSLSGDGKHMVFVSNYTSNNKMLLKYTYLDEFNHWTEPVELSGISRSELDFAGGHWLSYDGTLLFFTSKRNPGIGKYDIFFSERRGSYWTSPQNIGKPINSTGNDGHPSLSPDGRYLYFMRCKEMDNYQSDGCELYVAERRSENYWHEPTKLPYPINTGNEATPRIMPDGETLIFASKRPGGKGGFDLYQSRLVGGQWTKPLACDYLNTEIDDQFVSVPAHGNLAYYSTMFRNNYTIIEAQIPENLKPKKVVLAQGHVVEAGTNKPLDAVIQVYNARTKERDQFIRAKPDGSFFVLIKGEDVYDFSIVTRDNKHVYHANLYDLRDLKHSKIEDLFLELVPLQNGTTFVAEDIQFGTNSAEIRKESEIALLRLVKFLRDNPNIKIEVGAHTDEVRWDSIAVDPDLTEVVIDTLYQLAQNGSGEIDTAEQNVPLANDQEAIDTFHSVPENYSLRYSYHNDLTERQARAVADKLIHLGVPSHLVSAKGYGDQYNLLPNDSDENRLINRRIEIKVIQ
jgi:outer membrane protein OmpA-like peptidoglycan-associated protein